MSVYLVNDTDMTAIANAIRTKDGTQTTMTVSQMPTRISNIPSGGTDYLAMKCQGTLTSYTVPEGTTQIYSGCFRDCQTLESITFPSTLTTIGDYGFASCTQLTGNLVLPSNLTRIGSSAFYGCENLTTVTFPTNMSSSFVLLDHAFENCLGLKTLVNYNPGDAIQARAFYGTALRGDIYCGNFCVFGNYSLYTYSTYHILNIHLQNTDTSDLTNDYSFGTNCFYTNCRLVVPYSSDHSILAAYQTAFPTYSSIMIEETT